MLKFLSVCLHIKYGFRRLSVNSQSIIPYLQHAVFCGNSKKTHFSVEDRSMFQYADINKGGHRIVFVYRKKKRKNKLKDFP